MAEGTTVGSPLGVIVGVRVTVGLDVGPAVGVVVGVFVCGERVGIREGRRIGTRYGSAKATLEKRTESNKHIFFTYTLVLYLLKSPAFSLTLPGWRYETSPQALETSSP